MGIENNSITTSSSQPKTADDL
ncbi:MAG: hypothetical protein CFH01_01811, partial [Alphaproteobacteria bacterium MarineAlpha2_Bin1]